MAILAMSPTGVPPVVSLEFSEFAGAGCPCDSRARCPCYAKSPNLRCSTMECGDESRRSRDDLAAFARQRKKFYKRHQTYRARTDFAEVLGQRRYRGSASQSGEGVPRRQGYALQRPKRRGRPCGACRRTPRASRFRGLRPWPPAPSTRSGQAFDSLRSLRARRAKRKRTKPACPVRDPRKGPRGPADRQAGAKGYFKPGWPAGRSTATRNPMVMYR